jgi:hypothetical protein
MVTIKLDAVLGVRRGLGRTPHGKRSDMIIGAHLIHYSKDAAADRDFIRDVLKAPHVDMGHGWLMFGLPPSDLAIHDEEAGMEQKFLLMCEDMGVFLEAMRNAGRACTPLEQKSWGLLTTLTLPSGAEIGVYQPNHPRVGESS